MWLSSLTFVPVVLLSFFSLGREGFMLSFVLTLCTERYTLCVLWTQCIQGGVTKRQTHTLSSRNHSCKHSRQLADPSVSLGSGLLPWDQGCGQHRQKKPRSACHRREGWPCNWKALHTVSRDSAPLNVSACHKNALSHMDCYPGSIVVDLCCIVLCHFSNRWAWNVLCRRQKCALDDTLRYSAAETTELINLINYSKPPSSRAEICNPGGQERALSLRKPFVKWKNNRDPKTTWPTLWQGHRLSEPVNVVGDMERAVQPKGQWGGEDSEEKEELQLSVIPSVHDLFIGTGSL